MPHAAFPRQPAPQERSGRLLTLDERRVGARTVLSVIGEVDISNSADLRTAIASAGAGAFEIWVDLTRTTFMDSSGLHALSTARDRLAAAGLRLALICPEGPVLRVLALTGLDQTFEIHADTRTANYAALA